MDYNDRDSVQSASILPFPRRRGRPKSAHRGIDNGTPELIMKRLLGDTAETLDLCLSRGLITAHQHWCGIHLRWLYTLRYGAPGVRAIDPTHIQGLEIKMDNPEWRIEREKEYNEAIKKVTLSGHALLLMNVCVYNERPKFLIVSHNPKLPCSKESLELIAKLSSGLDVLSSLWGRK